MKLVLLHEIEPVLDDRIKNWRIAKMKSRSLNTKSNEDVFYKYEVKP